MIPEATLHQLRQSFLAGTSDYLAADLATCHPNTARKYRHALETAGQLPDITVRTDRNGRIYRAANIGAHRRAGGAPEGTLPEGPPDAGGRNVGHVWRTAGAIRTDAA